MNNDSVKRFVAKVIISFENYKYFAAFYDPALVRDGLGTRSGRRRGRRRGRKEEEKAERREGSYESCSMQKMRTVMGDGGRIICLPKRRAQLPYRI